MEYRGSSQPRLTPEQQVFAEHFSLSFGGREVCISGPEPEYARRGVVRLEIVAEFLGEECSYVEHVGPDGVRAEPLDDLPTRREALLDREAERRRDEEF